MKLVMSIITALSIATPVVAQDLLFAGPGDSIIQIDGTECPDRMLCMSSPNVTASYGEDVNIIVPLWAGDINIRNGKDRGLLDVYLRGMSDGYIVDICNICNCCTISLDTEWGANFQSWDSAPEEFLSPSFPRAMQNQ